MILKAVAENQEIITLTNPTAVCINMEDDTPADDISIMFPVSKRIPSISRFVLSSDDRTIFTGIADKQVLTCNKNGSVLTVQGRSMAALLLDNEAMPCNYYMPDDMVIKINHLKPFGINLENESISPYEESISVGKGVTHWEVIEEFCRRKYNSFPRITERGTAILNGKISTEDLLFSNCENDRGIPFTSITVKETKCKMLSEVYVRNDGSSSSYSLTLNNPLALSKGVSRVRYLNAVDRDDITVSHGEKMIKNSNKDFFELTLTCPTRLFCTLGTKCTVKHKMYNFDYILQISKLKYTLNSAGESTVITMRGMV